MTDGRTDGRKSVNIELGALAISQITTARERELGHGKYLHLSYLDEVENDISSIIHHHRHYDNSCSSSLIHLITHGRTNGRKRVNIELGALAKNPHSPGEGARARQIFVIIISA